ncbi:MAG: DUF211 domain-containing protein [Aeropyrum sp.]|nr:DUF211 domain-containing protein [Aeropyrum sp.]MCE4616426.1 DUF211 domain-containing protein [Aeropyrum sp.]
MPAPLRKVVLDVLKPIRGPSIIDVSREVASLPGIEGVNITVKEIDVETVTLTMTIEGSDIDYSVVERKLEELGCIVHSIDQAVAGRKIVEEEEVKQGE